MTRASAAIINVHVSNSTSSTCTYTLEHIGAIVVLLSFPYTVVVACASASIIDQLPSRLGPDENTCILVRIFSFLSEFVWQIYLATLANTCWSIHRSGFNISPRRICTATLKSFVAPPTCVSAASLIPYCCKRWRFLIKNWARRCWQKVGVKNWLIPPFPLMYLLM